MPRWSVFLSLPKCRCRVLSVAESSHFVLFVNTYFERSIRSHLEIEKRSESSAIEEQENERWSVSRLLQKKIEKTRTFISQLKFMVERQTPQMLRVLKPWKASSQFEGNSRV